MHFASLPPDRENHLAKSRKRPAHEPRPLTFERGVIENANGSALVASGATRVLCTVMVQDGVPQWMTGQGKAWLTAEYSMLPGSTRARKARDGRVAGRIDARSLEIQRMIGRALRAILDRSTLPELTFWVDCDVLNADGGTRTASINGACVALHDAIAQLRDRGRIKTWPLADLVSAVSVGMAGSELLVDLDYREDSAADVDLNIVRLGDGRVVEVQGCAERAAFTDEQLIEMLALSRDACSRIDALQRGVLGLPPRTAP